MALRGWRQGTGFGNQHAKQELFILFPDIDLPAVRDVTNEEKTLVVWNSRLQNYWKKSSYYLEETGMSVSQSTDIERYSDCEKPKAKLTHDSFLQYLESNASNFPRELVADLAKLDLFEKLEHKHKGQKDKDKKEKKEGEDEEQDQEVDDADGAYSDDADYNQNIDFDDDEDDFNMADDNDDEGIYCHIPPSFRSKHPRSFTRSEKNQTVPLCLVWCN